MYMQIIKENRSLMIAESDEKHDADYYYKNRIPSKFDKWLDYDFGGIRAYAIPFEEDKDKWYWYEEAWNFVGRQPDKKYYFRCSSSYDKDMIGNVLKFNRFNDVAKYVCLPDRAYGSVCEDSYDWGTIIHKEKITESLLSNAKKYFGTLPINDWELAFYINTDGTLLDGSGIKFGGLGNYRTTDHREISKVFNKEIDGYDAMLSYEKEGNIRFIPESQGFEIMKEPTPEQYNTIARISRQFNGNCGIDFINEYGDNIHSIEYDFARPYKIVQDIKDFFNSK